MKRATSVLLVAASGDSRPRPRSPTRARTPSRRSSSASTSRSAASGARRSTAGRKRSRSIRPTPPRSTTSAIAYEHEGQLDKARKAYEKALEIEPNNAQIRQNYELFKEINDRAAQRRTSNRLALGAIAAACAVLAVACGGELFEIPIETPIQAKLDVSAFQRVLVAGFVAGGTDDVDTNQETVRLLRSQLRTKSVAARDRRRRDAR